MPPKKTATATEPSKRVTRGRKSASLQEVDFDDFEEEEVKETPVVKGRGKAAARGKTLEMNSMPYIYIYIYVYKYHKNQLPTSFYFVNHQIQLGDFETFDG